VLVLTGDSPPTPIQVKAAHLPPWYVRSASLLGDHADQVTVLVLLGIDKTKKSARFFVAKNSELAAQFHRAPS
jgi:hypothetical protein